MSRQLLPGLEKLPRLVAASETRACKICGAPSYLFAVVDFNKYCSSGDPYEFGVAGIPVTYFRCGACEFIFSELIDDWTHEEISRYVYNEDYILVDPDYIEARPKHIATLASESMRGLENHFILDYGSGSGFFADEMTRCGYKNVQCYDPFSSPDRPQALFDVITCFEVIEHSAFPLTILKDIDSLLKEDGILLIGQTIQPDNIEDIREAWWYLGPRNGHVSTFSNFTFSELARKMQYVFRPGGAAYAFHRRGAEPTTKLRPLLEKVGPRYFGRVLLAPRETTGEEWHAREHVRTRLYRWSAKSEVNYGKFYIDCDVAEFKIPFLMEIQPGFAEQCVIQLDGVNVPTRVQGFNLIATGGSCAPGDYEVILKTPEPLVPRNLNGAPDDRPLGLAVRTLDDPMPWSAMRA